MQAEEIDELVEQVLDWRRNLRKRVVNPTKLLNLIQVQAKKKKGFRSLICYLLFLGLFFLTVFLQTDVASVYRMEADIRQDIEEVTFASKGRIGLTLEHIGMPLFSGVQRFIPLPSPSQQAEKTFSIGCKRGTFAWHPLTR